MKFFFKFSIVLFLSTFVFPYLFDISNQVAKRKRSNTVTQKVEESYINRLKYEQAYEEAIDFIKFHEGFNDGNAYYDVAGFRTIGYGHVSYGADSLISSMTLVEADELLRADFNKSLLLAKAETDFSGYKLIAVAHFIFTHGIGSFKRSLLLKKMLLGEPIENEFKKWCYYRTTTGRLVKSNFSYKIRLWEAQMYNRS